MACRLVGSQFHPKQSTNKDNNQILLHHFLQKTAIPIGNSALLPPAFAWRLQAGPGRKRRTVHSLPRIQSCHYQFEIKWTSTFFCCPGLASCRCRPLSSNVRPHKPRSSAGLGPEKQEGPTQGPSVYFFFSGGRGSETVLPGSLSASRFGTYCPVPASRYCLCGGDCLVVIHTFLAEAKWRSTGLQTLNPWQDDFARADPPLGRIPAGTGRGARGRGEHSAFCVSGTHTISGV